MTPSETMAGCRRSQIPHAPVLPMYSLAARPLQTATPVRPSIVAVNACQGKDEITVKSYELRFPTALDDY